jgi:predicted RNA methylase
MSKKNYNEILANCTKVILEDSIDYLLLKNAINDLKLLFEEVSEIDLNHHSVEEHIFLKTGKAIGSKWAGMCLEDFMRTKKFITGLYKAIKDELQKNKNKPVHVLYSGTGPFATLVLPLTTVFKSSELQLTLLEVNSKSLESLEKTIKRLKLGSYINEIHQCDATEFKIPSPNTINIVLIECMQHALAREPQVSITYNLVSQLSSNVILIPEQISLHIALIDSTKKNNYLFNSKSSVRKLDFYTNLKSVFVLNKKTATRKSDLKFPEVEVVLPSELSKNSDILAITTEITIYKNKKLTIDNSGLTIPLILAYLKNKQIKKVVCQYVVNENPELKTTLIT